LQEKFRLLPLISFNIFKLFRACAEPKSPGWRSSIEQKSQVEQPDPADEVYSPSKAFRFLQNVLLKTDSFYNDSKPLCRHRRANAAHH
jgi:hypothetical protein